MNNALYGLYGASGFGREIMPLLRAQVIKHGGTIEQCVFIDDSPQAESVNGHRIVSYNEFLALDRANKMVAIAIGNSAVRQKLEEKIARDALQPFAIFADNAVVMDEVTMAEGSIICPFVTLASNALIGKYFHANYYSYVAHDCRIGDFVTFAPRVMCNGNVVIEDHAYLGTGAIIRQGQADRPLTIGRGAVVGMGAVITKDVSPGVTVVGNPARPLLRG